MEKTKRGKGTKITAVADRSGLPIAICAGSASPHEVTLVDDVLEAKLTLDYPERLIGDKAYDSDDLDRWMKEQYGIEMIAPNRENRNAMTQDKRPLRRYKKRWKIERLFAWLHNFRRIQTRYDRRLENYLGFIHLGCIFILFRYL